MIASPHAAVRPAADPGVLLSGGSIVTTEEKKARNAEADADNGDARTWPGWFQSSTTFDQLVEQQGAGPFVWPEPCDEEDKFDVDDFLSAIFGEEMRR